MEIERKVKNRKGRKNNAQEKIIKNEKVTDMKTDRQKSNKE